MIISYSIIVVVYILYTLIVKKSGSSVHVRNGVFLLATTPKQPLYIGWNEKYSTTILKCAFIYHRRLGIDTTTIFRHYYHFWVVNWLISLARRIGRLCLTYCFCLYRWRAHRSWWLYVAIIGESSSCHWGAHRSWCLCSLWVARINGWRVVCFAREVRLSGFSTRPHAPLFVATVRRGDPPAP